MWARIVEFMLALWLALSPFIFGYSEDAIIFWCNDLISSSLIAFFALICYYKPLRKMHLCNLLMAIWLIVIGFISKEIPPPPFLQNYVVFGILLLMIALVPSESEKPPKPWRDFDENLGA